MLAITPSAWRYAIAALSALYGRGFTLAYQAVRHAATALLIAL